MENHINSRIVDIVQAWFHEGEIDYFLGYVKRSGGRSYPTVIRSAYEANFLIFDDECVHDLSPFLMAKAEGDRVGILLKGCDGNAVAQLIAEHQVRREDVKILGVVCSGLKADGVLLKQCRHCLIKTPPMYDELIEIPFREETRPLITFKESRGLEQPSHKGRAGVLNTTRLP